MKLSKQQEQALLRDLRKGDEKAFAVLFDMYKHKLFSFITDITRSEEQAKDLVQDVFLKIWNTKEDLPEIDNLGSFIFRVAQNKAIDQLRSFASRKIERMNKEFSDDRIFDDPYKQLFRREIDGVLKEAIDHLPPQQRKIFILSKEQGFSQAEIAAQLNLSISTIQNHMRQALINMRQYLSHAHPGLFAFILVSMPQLFFL
jgi:RNA polymerase sigma-70 factor (family 1)